MDQSVLDRAVRMATRAALDHVTDRGSVLGRMTVSPVWDRVRVSHLLRRDLRWGRTR